MLLIHSRPGELPAGEGESVYKLHLFFLLFGICLGIIYGFMEDSIKQFIVDGVNSHPELHDPKSISKIWRWWLRAHFHSLGIATFSLVLIVITALSGLSCRMKQITSVLLGFGGLYAMAWFLMALLAPSLGRNGAHHALPVFLLVVAGVGSLLAGMATLFANILFGCFSDRSGLQ